MNLPRSPIQLAAGLMTLSLMVSTGCQRRVLWDLRDDPYLQDMTGKSEGELIGMLRGMYQDDTQLALRVMAHRSAGARERGDNLAADRWVQMIIQQYRKDRNPETRGTIINLCAPICGIGSKRMQAFLRQRIAEGEWTIDASYSLAAVSDESEADVLVPLSKHPAHPIRYAAALALTGVGGQEARTAVQQVLVDMETGGWPHRIGELRLAAAHSILAARAERLLGIDMNMPYPPRQPTPSPKKASDLIGRDQPLLPSTDTLPEVP